MLLVTDFFFVSTFRVMDIFDICTETKYVLGGT
jgi:hypothetical protein